MSTEARYYKKEPVNKVRCLLCPHRCFLANNRIGICKVRRNEAGVLMTDIYGEITSYAMDPMEKKPLYHFYPGTEIFSIGTWGCNFKCTNCQNWTISQHRVSTENFTPQSIIEIAKHNNSVGIAYTYNEPFIGYEFMYDVSVLARENGLKNVVVTNGFVSEEPLRDILPYLDALNIDLKAGSESFYREVCDGQLAPVMRSIKQVYESGVHMELTYLVIPTLNDKPEEVSEVCDWIASVSPDIPVHFSRYHPQYKMDIEATPVETLKNTLEIAKSKLKYAYLGNVPSDTGGSDTHCASCKEVLIKRDWAKVEIVGLSGDKCAKCGAALPGRF